MTLSSKPKNPIFGLGQAYNGGVIGDATIEFRGSGSKLGLVAFYADCHHEVRPVKDGYRVVLTYNLMLEKTGESERQLAPVTVLAKLERRVRECFETPPSPRWPGARPEAAPDRIVYLLDHQYTQKGLSFRHLKNVDAARVVALREVARRLDCELTSRGRTIGRKGTSRDQEAPAGACRILLAHRIREHPRGRLQAP